MQCEESSHIHNNTKTTTFSIKKGHTFTTALKQQHLVQKRSHIQNYAKTTTLM